MGPATSGGMMPNGHGVEILLVEDNPNDVEMTLRALKKHHLANHVLVLDDGEKALEYLFGEGKYSGRAVDDRPKVILLDIKLPKVNGIEVLRRLKDDARTRTTPVVILTSSREEKDLTESYQLGVNSYIVKPVDSRSSRRRCRSWGCTGCSSTSPRLERAAGAFPR